jgi:hypothetical protein
MVMDKDKMLPGVVKVGAHLLAIDESRSFFRPVPWEGISQSTQELLQIDLDTRQHVGGSYQEDLFSSISLRRLKR